MKLPNTSSLNKKGLALSLSNGFTLIEVIVVMAIVGMIFMFGTILGFDSLTRSTVIDERDLLVTNLLATRARALANMRELSQGIHITDDSLVLFESSYTPGNPANRVISRNSNIDIIGTDEIIFEQLSGNITSVAGTITLTDGTQTQTIILNSAGRIDW